MGGVCGKDKDPLGLKKERGTTHRNSIKVNKPPSSEIFTRKQEWIGLKNLHNTCYISSGILPLTSAAMFFGKQFLDGLHTAHGSKH